jgi:hypothetical protein
METYFHKKIEVIKTIREIFSLEEFKKILNENKPNEIFNTEYSRKKPCWIITEYLDENNIKYYADGWANKTPISESIENIYTSWRIQGLENCYFC